MGAKLVGSFRLSTGWTCWTTVHDADVDAESAGAWAERKRKLRFQRKDPDADPFDSRAFGFDVLKDDGSFYFVDLAWPLAAADSPGP